MKYHLRIAIRQNSSGYKLDIRTPDDHFIEQRKEFCVVGEEQQRLVSRIRSENPKRGEIKDQMLQHGSDLFDWLAGKRGRLRTALESCVSSRELSLIGLEIEDVSLHEHLWELMYCSQPDSVTLGRSGAFLFECNISIARCVTPERPRELPSHSGRQPLINALVVLSAPSYGDFALPEKQPSATRTSQFSWVNPINLLPVVRALEKARSSVGKEAFDFTLIECPTCDRLEDELRTGVFNVLYYVGHCAYDFSRSVNCILLVEENETRAKLVDAEWVKSLLHKTSVKLVVLSACDTASPVTERFLTSFARTLCDAPSVLAVVGMQLQVPTYTAQAFDLAFFRELSTLASIPEAVAAGRCAMRQAITNAGESMSEVADWAIPVLFERKDKLYREVVDVVQSSPVIGFDSSSLQKIEQNLRPGKAVLDVLRERFLRKSEVVSQRFRIAAWPVTNCEYQRFLNEQGLRTLQSHLQEGKGMHPVVNIRYAEAESYCQWRGGRLPTADEWEVAARGKLSSLFPWGDSFESECCNLGHPIERGTTSVFSFPLGQSPGGMWDAVGNVWEWTSTSRQDESRVVMGGCWYSDPVQALPSLRRGMNPSRPYKEVGFRCAWDWK